MATNNHLNDYTIAVTDHQTDGRGQVHNSWISEPFKNLTFSVFTRLSGLNIIHQPYLNFAVCLGIFNSLKELSVPNLCIKWPNDIMSEDKKICGVLIETTFKNLTIKNTVFGIGLNVNQEKFPENLQKASSLKLILNKNFDLDSLMKKIVINIQKQLKLLQEEEFTSIHKAYLNCLYKKDVPMTFFDETKKTHFMGIICEVNTKGKLVLKLEDDSLKEFDTKEVSFAIT